MLNQFQVSRLLSVTAYTTLNWSIFGVPVVYFLKLCRVYLGVLVKLNEKLSCYILSRIMPILHTCRNQLTDLQCKSIDWFLYVCKMGLIWVKVDLRIKQELKKYQLQLNVKTITYLQPIFLLYTKNSIDLLL